MFESPARRAALVQPLLALHDAFARDSRESLDGLDGNGQHAGAIAAGLVSLLDGNLLLCRIAGAEARFITPEQYRRREVLLAEVRDEEQAAGRHCYVIPEGASSAIGSLGYVACARELSQQLLDQRIATDYLWHAVGSGGTTAGLLLGQRLFRLPGRVVGVAVCVA